MRKPLPIVAVPRRAGIPECAAVRLARASRGGQGRRPVPPVLPLPPGPRPAATTVRLTGWAPSTWCDRHAPPP
jgi:hypothetical protein